MLHLHLDYFTIIDWCICLMVVLFVFYFFLRPTIDRIIWLLPLQIRIIVCFWCHLLHLANSFDNSNHPSILILDWIVWTGAASAEKTSGCMILVENYQTLCWLYCPPDLKSMQHFNIKLTLVTKMKQFPLN